MLTHATLNGVSIYACDVLKAYFQVPSSKKYICNLLYRVSIRGLGKHTIIVCTLYGSKPNGADYFGHAFSAMEEMVFHPENLTLMSGSDLR